MWITYAKNKYEKNLKNRIKKYKNSYKNNKKNRIIKIKYKNNK